VIVRLDFSSVYPFWYDGLKQMPATSPTVGSPIWCNVVKARWLASMQAKKAQKTEMKAQSAAAVRASISFPPHVYETLEMIAKEKKVSIAWVVREAAEKYIADKWPLFGGSKGA
jgi:hypothetical protein